MRHLLATIVFLLASNAAPGFAQTRPPAQPPARPPARPVPRTPKPERIWLSINGGVQPMNNSFTDSFDVTLYTEPEHIRVDYPVKSGVLIAGSGGYRVWKKLWIGLGVTHYSASDDAEVAAQVPHPFFDNTYRNVEGASRLTRSEVGAHVMFGWMLKPSRSTRVLLTAGPSYISANQPIATEVVIIDTYPYDTAQFSDVRTTDSSRGAVGFNAGADVFWKLSKEFGVGGLAQITHASVRAPGNAGRSVRFDAGGAQVAGGVRFLF